MLTAHLGEIYALLTAICWVVGTNCFEGASRRIGSLVVNLIRLWIAVVLLGLLCWLFRGNFWPSDATRHVWIWISISGVIGFLLCDACLFRAFVLAGSRRSVLMMSMAPVFAALLDALVLRAPPALHVLIGLAMTLCGVVWVVVDRDDSDHSAHTRREIRQGMMLALAAAVFQALGAMASKKGMTLDAGGQYDALASTFIRVMVGAGCFTVLLLVSGRMRAVIDGTRNLRAMVLLTIGAVVGPVIGVTLFMASVQRVPTSVTQTILATMPILMLPIAHYVYGERITRGAIAGTFVAVAGVVVLCW